MSRTSCSSNLAITTSASSFWMRMRCSLAASTSSVCQRDCSLLFCRNSDAVSFGKARCNLVTAAVARDALCSASLIEANACMRFKLSTATVWSTCACWCFWCCVTGVSLRAAEEEGAASCAPVSTLPASISPCRACSAKRASLARSSTAATALASFSLGSPTTFLPK
eukprot:3219589-Pleurochrysis_carterae.AAC.1